MSKLNTKDTQGKQRTKDSLCPKLKLSKFHGDGQSPGTKGAFKTRHLKKQNEDESRINGEVITS